MSGSGTRDGSYFNTHFDTWVRYLQQLVRNEWKDPWPEDEPPPILFNDGLERTIEDFLGMGFYLSDVAFAGAPMIPIPKNEHAILLGWQDENGKDLYDPISIFDRWGTYEMGNLWNILVDMHGITSRTEAFIGYMHDVAQAHYYSDSQRTYFDAACRLWQVTYLIAEGGYADKTTFETIALFIYGILAVIEDTRKVVFAMFQRYGPVYSYVTPAKGLLMYNMIRRDPSVFDTLIEIVLRRTDEYEADKSLNLEELMLSEVRELEIIKMKQYQDRDTLWALQNMGTIDLPNKAPH